MDATFDHENKGPLPCTDCEDVTQDVSPGDELIFEAKDLIRRPWELEEKGISPNQLERILEQEQRILTEGADRFHNWLTKQNEVGGTDRTPGGRAVAAKFIPAIAEAIARFQAGEEGLLDAVTTAAIEGRSRAKTTGPLPGSTYRQYLVGMDPVFIAGMVFSNVLSHAVSGASVQSVSRAIVTSLETWAMTEAVREDSAKLAKHVMKQSAQRGDPEWVFRRRLNEAIAATGAAWEPWDTKEAMKMAMTLVRMVTDLTGMATLETTLIARNRRETTLRLHPEVLDLLNRNNNSASRLWYTVEPFIAPPRDWYSPTDGVFWGEGVVGTTILGKNARKGAILPLIKAHREGKLEAVLTAINTLQATPFRINRRVLDVMKHLWESGVEMEGHMPQRENKPIPPMPSKEAGEELWQEWKQMAAKAHQANRQTLSTRLAFQTAIGIAEDYRKEKAIWFGWRCDFRGRMYPMQTGLSPQGSENQKALLEFATGRELGTFLAADWLAIHGANSWGEAGKIFCDREPNKLLFEGKVDKASLHERVLWVHQNTAKIVACAEDPLSTTWWRQAGDPWLFLAFCFEWAGYQKQGLAFKSHLPIAIDGTCNGLQHLSAMVLDEEGGSKVNLVPSDRPSDIYKSVAGRLKGRLKQIVQTGGGERGPAFARGAADLLEFGFDRKVTKRVVMTIPYGLSQHGANKYTRDAMEERARKTGAQLPWRTPCGDLDHDRIQETRTLFEIELWEAVHDRIGRAMAVMKWMQDCCALVTGVLKEDFRWTAPTGWPVMQLYRKTKPLRINVNLKDARQTMLISLPTSEISPKDHRTGAAPNIVHSFDAAHMVFTTNLAHQQGVMDFMMVHDSFACHAAAMPTLHEAVRETFVAIYSTNQLARLLGEWKEMADASPYELKDGTLFQPPALPFMGELDITSVRRSSLFFS